jgi:TRAP-type mannitol/chloroaromatic compound transport system permease small subunit
VRAIDSTNAAIGRAARWALLLNALLIAGNALSRTLFGVYSPLIYDLQWHFFAAVVLLMAAYTLQRDEHVRVDVLSHRLGERGMAWLDLAGMLGILVPVCLAMVWITTPAFVDALLSGETRASKESGSYLPVWIIRGFVWTGFLLLALQGVAEALRCIACLRNLAPRPVRRRRLIEGTTRDG